MQELHQISLDTIKMRSQTENMEKAEIQYTAVFTREPGFKVISCFVLPKIQENKLFDNF
jgi:hypothetical protein